MTLSPLTGGGRDNRSLSGERRWIVTGRITTQYLQSRTSLHTCAISATFVPCLFVVSRSNRSRTSSDEQSVTSSSNA